MPKKTHKPIIFLDCIVFRIQKFGGASTYWKELLVNFIKLNNVSLIIQSEDISKLNNDGKYIVKYLNNNIKLIIEKILPVSVLRYLPFTKRLPPGSIYHASYYRTCLQKNVVNIFTVHDFTHKKGYASKFPRKFVHIGLTFLGLKNADGIICISENTKKDLFYYYPFIPKEKVRVIYHGVSENFFPLKQSTNKQFRGIFSLHDPFILFIGKRGGYKKFDIVASALKQTEYLKLVIIGGGEFSHAEKLFLESTLEGRYVKFEGVEDTELNILYNHAYALLYPSIYEGFGFPVIEAMRAGCPVITTNLSSIPEVAGDAALFINEISDKAIIEKIALLQDINLRKTIIEKGFQQSEKFSWGKSYLETLKFYEDVCKQKFGS
jgi:glycosyltransferase involved in cell wall biosynthesis